MRGLLVAPSQHPMCNEQKRWQWSGSGRRGCDEKALEDSLCKRVIVTPDGNITKPLDPASAVLSRDAMAKTVYSRLFDWIVDKINSSIGQDPTATSIIGVLDIYGFESFKINSFEQLCINLTNEKLQQHFNQHVFKMEQEESTREEINWSYVEFVDNQDVLDLIEKKPGGIKAILDEAWFLIIEPFCELVTYQADQFLDKNKDYVVAEHLALLDASRCPFVANLFPPLPEETSKQSKFSSIGTRFKQQLQALMETLNTTEPHYIRCVKPNTVLKPGIFENINVLNQLRCGGVLEAIRISCAGYPTKRTFDEFLDRFGILLLRRECCSFSNGEYVKAGLQELEQWCRKASDQFAGSSWDELRHIRQAVWFLVSHQKAQKSLEEITNELCPMLSIPQIYRIGTMFWDDKYGTQGLSSDDENTDGRRFNKNA
ncbi:hypothetical protein D5086_002106 [Populus alba]|uniref:Uncharacterized protein n=1 Tax=Populus alba TaxID=43335 RepID=A0ACC4D0M2_POPAL